MNKLMLSAFFIFPLFHVYSQNNEKLIACWRITDYVDGYDEYVKFTEDTCIFEVSDTRILKKRNSDTGQEYYLSEYLHWKEIGSYKCLNDSMFQRNYYFYYSELYNLKELPVINCDSLILKDRNENLKYHKFMKEMVVPCKNRTRADTLFYKIQNDILFIQGGKSYKKVK